jgi:hypothetical protein
MVILSRDKKVYSIEAILGNSFNETLKELINYVLSDFDVEKVSYNPSTNIQPDSIKIANYNYSNKTSQLTFCKPKYIFAQFNFIGKGSWTNSGGYEFCECILKDKSKILVNWDTNTDYKKFEKLDIKFIRKLKLKKIENA